MNKTASNKGFCPTSSIIFAVILSSAFFLLLSSSGSSLFPVLAQEKKTVNYTGIMLFLYSADDVVIVSPTGNAKKIEEGKLSCERKKSYLEKNFETKARIVADTALSEEDRKGNLIIVGKENKLLQEIWQKTPIRTTPDSFFFLEEEYANPREQTIFFQVNPFNASRSILVCTSIDPDIDKIRPIPQIGSDWVIMRDLSIIRQGRFYGGTSLPPGSDSLAEFHHGDAVDQFYKGLIKVDSQYYEVYYSPDSPNKERIAEGARKRDAALLTILKKAGVKPPDRKFKIYCYKNKEEKVEIFGAPDPIHFLDGKKEIHMFEESLFANSTHEDAHILAGFILSDRASIPMTEGLALWLDGAWKGKSLWYWSGFFQRLGKLPPLARLLDEGEFIRFSNDYSFPLIGSLTGTIIEKYGMEKFRVLLGLEAITDDLLKGATGQSVAQLESAWLSDIKARSAAYSKEIEFALRNDAARQFLEKKDFLSASRELLKALEIIPDDPQALFNLAAAYIRVPDLKLSEKYLLKLLSLKLPESEVRFIAFGHYQLGRVYDLMGNREKALAEYEKVLALPDLHNSHRLAKDRMDRPASEYDFD